jgi:hypothetical protein
MTETHQDLSSTPRKSGAGVVVVRGSAAGFMQEILAGPHRMIGDEPASAGGCMHSTKGCRSRMSRSLFATPGSTPPIAPNAKPRRDYSIASSETFTLPEN